MDFSSRLLFWYDEHKRDLPWRDSEDPYKVWISEVILQQTRINQGLSYYHRFLDAFPDVTSLASASEDEVLRLWQGLGYYSRARNLHEAARYIVSRLDGNFPGNSRNWMEIKGVGPYTAAAIASIVFKENVPALDGNGYRVLARIFELPYKKDTSEGKKQFFELATRLIDPDRPGDFNQAIMDFGALVCKPLSPACVDCPMRDICNAFKNNTVDAYPMRSPKRPVRKRFFNYFRITTTNTEGNEIVYINKRRGNDIWKNMYDYPLLETKSDTPPEELFNHVWWRQLFPNNRGYLITGHSEPRTHKLTHQTIHAKLFFVLVEPGYTDVLNQTFIPIKFKEYEMLAKPRLIELLHGDVNKTD